MAAQRQCPVCGAALASDAPLGHCPQCLFRLGFAAGAEEPDFPAEPAGPDWPSATGSRVRYFGDYELIEEIGRGGMGVVFKARQISLNRVVAVKMLLSGEWAGPDFEQRFRLEAEAAASLDHPNIVAIHEVGVHEGQHYFSMDYVEGQTLAERVRDNPLPPELAADYLKTIAGAVHYAHQRGILHRDLKPSNILIDPLDQPRITDFGLAKRLTDPQLSTLEPHLTLTGQVLGSPSYVSPEQAAGRTHELTVASDIYSLGAILYEMLTGKPPFQGDTPVATLRKVMDDEPVRPRALNSAIDRDLETICLKCLEKAPVRRYGSAIALADDLERWRRGEPILARRATLFERVAKWARRQPVLAAAVVLLHLVLASGLAGILWEWHQAVVARRAEAAERQRAVRAEADALAHFHGYVRANRLTGRPGQRFGSLAELAAAAARTNQLDLRNEAIACLVLPDLRRLKQWAKTPRWDSFRFDASFRRYATNDALGNLTIRDTETDTMLAQIPAQGAQDVASFAAFSPDDRFVATIDQGAQAHIWDWPTQTPRLMDVPRGAALMAFTPDNRALVGKYPDGSLHFLNTTNGAEEKSFPGPSALVWKQFKLDSSGEKFLTITKGEVIIRRTSDGRHLKTLKPPEGATDGLWRAAWHPDGCRVACAWQDHIGLWDVETGYQLGVFAGHEGLVVGLAFTRTGQYLASASWDHTTRLWDTDTQREVLILPESGNGLSISADNRRLSFETWDNTQVKLYELADLTSAQRVTLPPQTRALAHYTAQAVFSPDGRLIMAPDKDAVYVFHAPRSTPVARVPVPETYSVCFARDGSALFTGGANGAQRWPIVSSSDRSEVHLGPPEVLEPTRGLPVSCVDLSRDGQWLVVQATVAPAKKAILALQTASAIVKFATSNEVRSPPNVSPDGRWVATISRSSDLLQVWDVPGGGLVTNLPTPGASQCAFSADNRWLACAQKDSTTVWETADWSLCCRVAHPSDDARHRLAFSPDGRILAIAVSDQEIRLVKSKTGEELATLPAGRLMTSLGFSPTGDRLAVAHESGYFQLWDLRRVREQLAALHLDWDMPAYPPEQPALWGRPLRVIVHTNAPANPAGTGER